MSGMLVQHHKKTRLNGDERSPLVVSGRVGGSDVGESSTKSDPRDDGPDELSSKLYTRTYVKT